MLGPGQVFGETDVGYERGYSYSLRSKTYNATVFLVSAKDFKKFNQDYRRDEVQFAKYKRAADIKWANKLAQ